MTTDKNAYTNLIKEMKGTLDLFQDQFPLSDNLKVTSVEEYVLEHKRSDQTAKNIIVNVDEEHFDPRVIEKLRQDKLTFRANVQTNKGL